MKGNAMNENTHAARIAVAVQVALHGDAPLPAANEDCLCMGPLTPHKRGTGAPTEHRRCGPNCGPECEGPVDV